MSYRHGGSHDSHLPGKLLNDTFIACFAVQASLHRPSLVKHSRVDQTIKYWITPPSLRASKQPTRVEEKWRLWSEYKFLWECWLTPSSSNRVQIYTGVYCVYRQVTPGIMIDIHRVSIITDLPTNWVQILVHNYDNWLIRSFYMNRTPIISKHFEDDNLNLTFDTDDILKKMVTNWPFFYLAVGGDLFSTPWLEKSKYRRATSSSWGTKNQSLQNQADNSHTGPTHSQIWMLRSSSYFVNNIEWNATCVICHSWYVIIVTIALNYCMDFPELLGFLLTVHCL